MDLAEVMLRNQLRNPLIENISSHVSEQTQTHSTNTTEQTQNTHFPNNTQVRQQIWSSFAFSIHTKLDKTNFLIWKAQVLPTIHCNGMEGYINGIKVEPYKHLAS